MEKIITKFKNCFNENKISEKNKQFLVNFTIFKIEIFVFFFQLVFEWLNINIYSINFIKSQQFTLYSIIISIFSVLMAALTIVFSNNEICGMRCSTILKKVFRIQFLICRFAVFLSPFLMLFLIIFNFNRTFFVLFVISIFNLFYLLHLCLAIHLDYGVKYSLIPEKISEEYILSFEKKEFQDVSLYLEFINSVNTKQVVEFKKMLILVIKKIIETKNKEQNCTLPNYLIIYKEVSFLFNDIKKWLIKNTDNSDEFIKVYFQICEEAGIQTEKNYLNFGFIIYSSILINIIECIGYQEIKKIDIKAYKYNLSNFFDKVMKGLNKEDKWVYIIASLIVIEIILQKDKGEECVFEFIYNIINKYIYEVIDFLGEQKDFNSILENKLEIMVFILFPMYEDANSICHMDIYSDLKEDILLISNYYAGKYNEKQDNEEQYKSYTFLLYKILRLRRE